MSRKRVSRNAPCPCGSRKKYKNCCWDKGVEDDPDLGSDQQLPQYPIGTVVVAGASKMAHDVAPQKARRPGDCDLHEHPSGYPRARLCQAASSFFGTLSGPG
jgi:hypothetical protein